jgi:hypothetical protein
LLAAVAVFVIGSLAFVAAPVGPDPEDDAVPEVTATQ